MGLGLLCAAYMADAQQISLSVNDVFEIADSTNLTIEVAKYAVDAAQAAFKSEQYQKLPDLSVSASVSYNGTGYVWDRDFRNGMRVDIPSFGNNFALQASQVIYAGGVLAQAEKLAALGVSMTEVDLEKNRMDVYFTLCGYLLDMAKIDKSVLVYRKNIELAHKIIDNLKARLEAGNALTNDITRYQLHIESLELQKKRLENTRRILNQNLIMALHLDESVEILPIINFSTEEPTLEFSEASAVKKMDIAVSMSKAEEKLTLSEMLPQIALMGSANIDGPVLIEVPALNKNFHYWYVGLGVKYNIASLYKSKGRLKSSKLKTQSAIAQQNNVREQLSQAVFAANVKYNEAADEIRMAENNLNLAKENYETISNRYENGIALMTDMLDASNMVLSSEIELHNAQITQLYRYYELKYITGTLSKK